MASDESEAVRTTIVGGRPPGSGRSNVPVPRGIEVLVKKAAVDAEFRELLLLQRGRAAASIELVLDPAESAMLSAIPKEQLARIVDQTEVATELRPAFAGRVGAVMLAALGAGLVTSSVAKPTSVLPDPPHGTASAPEVSTSANPTLLAQGTVVFGNRALWPPSPPPTNLPTNPPPSKPPTTNSPPTLIKGLRADMIPAPGGGQAIASPTNRASTNPPLPVVVVGATATPPTNPPPISPPPAIRGIRPGRPPVIMAGFMAQAPSPTDAPATNPPATNAVPPKAAPGSGAGVQPDRPVFSFGLSNRVPPPKAPKTNAPGTKPPAKNPENQK